MSTIKTKDGTQLYYNDWELSACRLQPRLALTRTPSASRQMFFLASAATGASPTTAAQGRSSQPWNGNDLDTYADDLATLIEAST